MPCRLRFANISKAFPGVLALDDVSFDVAPGSIHAVVGENGAGKSTLMKVLAGAHRPDGGTIALDDETVEIADTGHARRLGIATVYQELHLVGDLTVAENVFLGRWPRLRGSGLIRFDRITEETERLFASLGVSIEPRAMVRNLSIAQQQMVEIAKALAVDARVVTLDEPSAVLTPHELDRLFDVVRTLAKRGVSILYISHRLEEIFALADTVTVLRDGRHIATRDVSDVTRAGLIHDMVGRPVDQEFPPRSVAMGDVRVQVMGLCAGEKVRDVSFEIRGGEVLALTGLVGSGRSTVAKAVFGYRRATSGTVQVDNLSGPFRSPREAMRAGVALLPEDRKREGLLLERPIRENITLADPGVSVRGGLLSLSGERRLATELMATHNVKADSSERAARTLSGGNQQKVLLGRWLQRECALLILDEPTRGVDIGAKVEIYEKLNVLAGMGLAILMISSELPEVIGMADRIAVMCDGRLTGILDNSTRSVSQEAIMNLAVAHQS